MTVNFSDKMASTLFLRSSLEVGKLPQNALSKSVENFVLGVTKFSTLFWNHQTVGICVFFSSVASRNRHGGGAPRTRAAATRLGHTTAQQAAAMVQTAAAADDGTAKAAALVVRLKHACVACAVRKWEWAVGRGCGVLQPARSREKASTAASDICASLDPRCPPNRERLGWTAWGSSDAMTHVAKIFSALAAAKTAPPP